LDNSENDNNNDNNNNDNNLPKLLPGMVLCGNKCDLALLNPPKRAVTFNDGQNLAKELGIPFYEVSAKEAINHKLVYEEVVKLHVKYMEEKTNLNNVKDASTSCCIIL